MTALSLKVPTIPLEDVQPGDVGLCHSTGMVGLGIRIVQRLNEPAEYATYNHAFVFSQRAAPTSVRAGEWMVCQAEAKGTVLSFLNDVAPGGSYVAISADSFETVDNLPIDRARIVAAAKDRLGMHYGFVEIASILASDLTPRFMHIDFSRPSTLICSAYAARSLEGGGALIRGNPLVTSPANLAHLAADHGTAA